MAALSSGSSPFVSIVSPLRRGVEEAAAVAKNGRSHSYGAVYVHPKSRPAFLPQAQPVGGDLQAKQRHWPFVEMRSFSWIDAAFLRWEEPRFLRSSIPNASSRCEVKARTMCGAAKCACRQPSAAARASRRLTSSSSVPPAFLHSNGPHFSHSVGSLSCRLCSLSTALSLPLSTLDAAAARASSCSSSSRSSSPGETTSSSFDACGCSSSLTASRACLVPGFAQNAAGVSRVGCLDSRTGGGRRAYSGEPRIRNKNSSHTSEWIKRQITDRYVLRAQERNLRSRAAFKLEQLDDDFLFFRKNQVVVDLGAYPGGWSQVALDRIRAGGGEGRVIAVDPVAMDPLPHHTFIQGSVGQAGTLQALLEELGESKADVVLSDMAPACIGVKQDDHLNCAELCLFASDLMEQVLKLGGTFVTKMFMGSETNNFKVYLRTRFKKVSSAKPRACRQESREMYFVCQHFVGRDRLAEEVQLKGCFTGKEGFL
ncbi:ribosomal RNA methyltransferase (FtsJ) family protein [Toxoplasma gondii MAS]|uniref:rRNA methyltransferase 2, mitochondrial n=1 Tax=Toxoplasma gondii MAS TaxID=943118 RepID=A0A086PKY8_TOXGO|nr:ribosomal RNA methyltransferase (FtsJ) family protein [Toxoplasma gondii MAS]